MTIVSGHQPAYLPWAGLFHKVALCDLFVYMDTVQYLHGDWNNRNRIRTPAGWTWLTVPVRHSKGSTSRLDEIRLDHTRAWQVTHWETIRRNYRKAPYFASYAEELEEMYVGRVWHSLLDLCWAQFNCFLRWLKLTETRVVRMSEASYKGTKDELVLDYCRKLGADAVVFGALGREYVRKSLFDEHEIRVHFQDYHCPEYRQRFNGFVPCLSTLDLVMNHGSAGRDIMLSGNLTKADLRSGEYWVA